MCVYIYICTGTLRKREVQNWGDSEPLQAQYEIYQPQVSLPCAAVSRRTLNKVESPNKIRIATILRKFLLVIKMYIMLCSTSRDCQTYIICNQCFGEVGQGSQQSLQRIRFREALGVHRYLYLYPQGSTGCREVQCPWLWGPKPCISRSADRLMRSLETHFASTMEKSHIQDHSVLPPAMAG